MNICKKIFTITIFICALVNAEPLKFDDSVKQGKLDNGLTYYILHNDNPKNTAYFYLNINTGSIDEDDSEQGLAHFVEHMAFNGSRNFEKNDLIRKLKSLGVKFGPDLNASTSFMDTTYNIQISTENSENIDSALLVLHDWADGIKFPADEVEKEKGVILEEAKKDVSTRFYEKRAQHLYPNSIFSMRFPIGKNEIIANTNREKLLGYYQRMYQPEIMSIIVVGDINVENIENKIKKEFSSIKNTPITQRVSKKLQSFKAGYANLVEKEAGMDVVNVIFNDEYLPVNSTEKLKQLYIKRYISLLLELSYKKINENTQNPLIAAFGEQNLFHQRTHNVFSMDIISKDAEKSLDSLFAAIKGVRKYGFAQDDFDSVKRELINNNQTEYERNDTQQYSLSTILQYVYHGTVKLSKQDKYDLGVKILNELTLSDINEYFKKMTDKDMLVELISQDDFANINDDKVNKIYRKAKPYNFTRNSKKIRKELLENIPQAQAFLSDTFNQENQLHTINLNNGATVILKDIKTTKNKVDFLAVKKGGISNISNPQQNKIAFSLLNFGTIGNLDRYEAQKLTQGYSYTLNMGMSDIATTIRGRTATNDLEKMLQEFYIRFQEPKLLQTSFDLYKPEAISDIEKRNQTVSYRFDKEVLDLFYQDNHRVKPLEVTDINQANLDLMQKEVDKYFANAGEYLFIFSGDLNIEETKRLIAIYLANLSGQKDEINIKDDGVYAITGNKRIVRDYGDSDKSEVSITLRNDKLANYDKLNRVKFNALKDVIQSELMEKVREDDGRIYSVAVAGEYRRYPHPTALLDISFSCKEEYVDEIVEEIRSILNRIKSKGSKPEHLDNFKNATIVAVKRNSQRSEFWISDIMMDRLFDIPLYEEKAYEKEINSITQKDIQDMLKTVDVGNFFVAVLNPKK
ncbi:MAG: insulinase family protein [Neisseriaceae bacterium]|nr:insulinase family protein [Neisseriaceae bacterium]